MVKHLRHFWTVIKRLVLISTILLLALGFWLHGGERSLQFAKPWIENAINGPDAPYTVAIGSATIDWSNAAMLGSIRIKNVTFAKRDGNVFAQLPDVYATIDPLGFLPSRRFLHKVIIHKPRMFAARNHDKVIELGFEDSPSRMPLQEMVAFFVGEKIDSGPMKPPTLPFKQFIIDDATLTFTDVLSETKIVSTPFDLNIRRRRGSYEAAVSMPFTVDDHPVKLLATLKHQPTGSPHLLTVQLTQMPARLICLFDTCPDKVAADGVVNGTVSIGVAEDMTLNEFRATLDTPKAVVTLPEWFAEPLKLGVSNIVADGIWSKRIIQVTQVKLALEDTNITATANLHRGDDGWYVTADAETTRLNVDKIYKYWPLTMAPDSRAWITSKLKSGYAAKGTLKLNLTPEDIAADNLSEKAVTATADAREIQFEYLPGFPLVDKMDGMAHFTGTTVRVVGGNGSLMSGAKVSKAVLWCPDLNNVKNPMEVDLELTAPASDVATMLALKHFPFDDSFGLDPKTINGTMDATMKLKFDAFSGNENSDPNEIHLEAVDYNIAARMNGVAQNGIYGGYDVKDVTGELKASNTGLYFDGTVALGDAGTSQVKLSQDSGKPLDVMVKSIGVDNKAAVASNDFTLNYVSSAIPAITIRGKKLDGSVSYGKSENSLLANFPAMKLNIKLDELFLVKGSPFTNVVGFLNCTAIKCDASQFTAKAGRSTIKGGITTNAGQRQLLVTSGDAGAMLKGLDITDRMTKGAFDLRGTYDDKKSPPQLNARLLISDFTLQNSQILGRILSIGSLTGLKNALTGSGISFDKLSANITSRAGIITVDKGFARGTAIGITVGGKVDTNTTKLDLKGVVAPAYALNSILGNIPIIGALAGGDQGLIAFNYSVRGTYENPDVGVNPLSGLTPGFLRGIFGVFDEKDTKSSTDSKETPASSKDAEVNNPVSRVQKR